MWLFTEDGCTTLFVGVAGIRKTKVGDIVRIIWSTKSPAELSTTLVVTGLWLSSV